MSVPPNTVIILHSENAELPNGEFRLAKPEVFQTDKVSDDDYLRQTFADSQPLPNLLDAMQAAYNMLTEGDGGIHVLKTNREFPDEPLPTAQNSPEQDMLEILGTAIGLARSNNEQVWVAIANAAMQRIGDLQIQLVRKPRNKLEYVIALLSLGRDAPLAELLADTTLFELLNQADIQRLDNIIRPKYKAAEYIGNLTLTELIETYPL